MRRFKWWLRGLSQRVFPRFTLAVLANRTWLLEPEVALVPLLARQNKVAVDIGANKGVYLFHLSRHFAEVFAFEPLPALADYLQRAAPRNAHVAAVAMSDHGGEAVLKLPRGFNELGSLEPHTAATWTTDAALESHVVALQTLDNARLHDVGFIKIDVEGHELAVLHGARETLLADMPAVLVEVEERHRPGNVEAVLQYMESLGYAGFYLDGFVVKPVSQFTLARDQPIESLSHSVKVGRYINNFLFFDASEAPNRVASMNQALSSKTSLELLPALEPGHAVTRGERLMGPLRAARDILVPSRVAS